MMPPLRNAILLGLFWTLVICICIVTTIPGRGISLGGATPPGTMIFETSSALETSNGNETPAPPIQPPAPFLISQPGPGQTSTTWLYAPPVSSPCVVYDRLSLYAWGANGTRYAFLFAGEWTNGTISGDYLNLSFNATNRDNANARLIIGTRSWSWSYLIIRHKDIGYSPSELGNGNPYDLQDLIRERNRTATAVILAGALFAPPVVYFLVREWLNRRGATPL
jgi:hypothetical protein